MSGTLPHEATASVYQLKVGLCACSPLIWRRLLVTSDTTIAQLHTILQTALGWEDVHLHRFRVHGKEYGLYREGGLSFADDPHQVHLAEFQLRPGERFVYEYDLIDFWQHDIRLEHILTWDLRKTYPVCIAGARACPLEDCGGPAGYQRLLEARESWEALEQMHADVLLVGQRLLAFYDGGPRPTFEDTEFMDALERMRERETHTPIPFQRRRVNTALRQLRKESLCNSASK